MFDSAALVGTELAGGYRIVRVARQEEFSTVFEAERERGGALDPYSVRRVAYFSAGDDELDRLRGEIEKLRGIGHPRIAIPVCVERAPDGAPCIVYPGFLGDDLQKRMVRGARITQERTLAMVRAIAETLIAAHRVGVVHRTLSPTAIRLDPTSGDLIALTDFGVGLLGEARWGGPSATSEPVLVSSPGFLSPEQARGDVDAVDDLSDQFALAAVVYLSVSGKAPFGTGQARAILSRVQHADPPPLVGATREVEKAVMRALAKRKSERFPTLPAFIETLEMGYGKRRSPIHGTLHVPGVRRHPRDGRGTIAARAQPSAPTSAPSSRAPAVPDNDSQDEDLDTKYRRGRLVRPTLIALTIGAAIAVGYGAYSLLSRRGAGTAVPIGGAPRDTNPEVVVTVELDPPEARILVGGHAVEGVRFRLPRSREPLALTVAAPGFQSYTGQLLPDVDRHLVVHLVPALTDALRDRAHPTNAGRGGDRSEAERRRPANDLRDPFSRP